MLHTVLESHKNLSKFACFTSIQYMHINISFAAGKGWVVKSEDKNIGTV